MFCHCSLGRLTSRRFRDGRLVWRKFQLGLCECSSMPTVHCASSVSNCCERNEKFMGIFPRDSEDYLPTILNGCLFISQECCCVVL